MFVAIHYQQETTERDRSTLEIYGPVKSTGRDRLNPRRAYSQSRAIDRGSPTSFQCIW